MLLDLEAADAGALRSKKGRTFDCVGHPACPVATANSDAITRRMAAAIGAQPEEKRSSRVSPSSRVVAGVSSPPSVACGSTEHCVPVHYY